MERHVRHVEHTMIQVEKIEKIERACMFNSALIIDGSLFERVQKYVSCILANKPLSNFTHHFHLSPTHSFHFHTLLLLLLATSNANYK
jgi:hypothetical protein